MTESDQDRHRMALGTRILVGVLAGIALGIFLGELATPFHVAGKVYVGLLQMTILPYVTLSLITKIGRLSMAEATRLAGRAGIVLLVLWGIALAIILIMPLSLPTWDAGSFFSASLVERPEEFDFLGLYLPINPFHSFANNVVPAAVLFSVLLGVGLIGVPQKAHLLDSLDVVSAGLSRIAGFVVRLSPYGTFALTAGAAGTLLPEELVRLAGYVVTYTIAVVLLTFVILPGLVAAVTPFRYGELLAAFREAGLTAFATGKLFAVLTMIIEGVKRVLVRRGLSAADAAGVADVYIPLAYPFPHSGKLLALLFIPFAAWFVGRPIELGAYPLLLSVGLLSFFGSPVAAIPFLLDLLKLPTDLFPLFLVAGIWCGRIGDMLGVMHLSAFTLLCAAWSHRMLRLRPVRLGIWCGAIALVGIAALFGNHALIRLSLANREPSNSLIKTMELTFPMAPVAEVVAPGPHPHPLMAGETRLARIRRTQTLRIGFLIDHPPFSYKNAAGHLVGFDIDLVQRLASELQAQAVFVPYTLADLATHFDADRFDLAVGAIASSIDHFGHFNESVHYLELHAALVVLDHQVKQFRSLEQIRQTKLRVGYAAQSYLARTRRHRFPKLEIVQLATEEAYLQGKGPQVDALLTMAETGAVLAMLYPNFSVVIPEGTHAKVPIVFAIHGDADELDRLIDAWLQLKKDDGTVDELYTYWILGKQPEHKTPRWSVMRDVLGWIE